MAPVRCLRRRRLGGWCLGLFLVPGRVSFASPLEQQGSGAGGIVEPLTASSTCELPPNITEKYDLSDCQTRKAERLRRCTVRCGSAWYGSDETLTCPKAGNGTWQGDLPVCSPCSTTKRPSKVLKGVQDSCSEVEKGGSCSAVCSSVAGDENATKESFTCQKESTPDFPWQPRECTCFTSGGEDLLDCDWCVQPDVGPQAALYDVSDCTDHNRHGSCIVKCAPLRGDASSTFTCVGPPYRTSGSLPSCSAECDIKVRPQAIWGGSGVVDNCGDRLQANQACVAGCSSGYTGEEQLFVCLSTANSTGGECSCFAGQKPHCRRERDCFELPGIPNATLVSMLPVLNKQMAQYRCDDQFTKDGRPDGATTLELLCQDGYLQQLDKVGCSPVNAPPVWRTCPLNASFAADKSLDISRCGSTPSATAAREKHEGESCLVTCAAGYYEPTARRFEAPVNSSRSAPTLLECRGGYFYGDLPQCLASNAVHEFDVYAVLRSGENGTLLYPWGEPVEADASGQTFPSNINVFDLEGLLQHIYTELLFFQQELAEMPKLFRDSSTGRWTGQPAPNYPVTRDQVDTAVWYRMEVQNPELSGSDAAYAEYGIFADFQQGGAANTDAAASYSGLGGPVGAEQQIMGYVKIYSARPGSPATDAECADASWIGAPDWKEQCQVEDGPEFDPRYMPVDRFIRFSLPGACPNLPHGMKRSERGGLNSSCATGAASQPFLGGNCSQKPSGAPDCTYRLKEVARVPLGHLTGMSSQTCGGRPCKDLRSFQVGCDNAHLRNGVKMSQAGNGTGMRECTEYVVGGKALPPKMGHRCGNETVEKAKVWSCLASCNTSELATGVLQNRCSSKQNDGRLQRMRELFQNALDQRLQAEAIEAPAELAPMLQDCELHEACASADSELGLGYCHRDVSGLCTPCYVPNTSAYDETRTTNMVLCRSDLFTSGGYGDSANTPDCSCGDANDTSCLPCCAYTQTCPRQWKVDGDWAECPTTCGQRLQLRKAECIDEAKKGDCRRSLGDGGGDPGGSGWCDGTGCFEARYCNGTQCPWLPFCSDDQAEDRRGLQLETEEAPACMPKDWGPLDSGCARGRKLRYARCSYYNPQMPDFGGSFCAKSAEPPSRREAFSSTQSRLPHCARCSLEDGPCTECAAPEVFSMGKHARCSNTHPLLQLEVTVLLPLQLKEQLLQLGFLALESLLQNATAKASQWLASDVFLVDAFEDLDFVTADVDISSMLVPGGAELRQQLPSTWSDFVPHKSQFLPTVPSALAVARRLKQSDNERIPTLDTESAVSRPVVRTLGKSTTSTSTATTNTASTSTTSEANSTTSTASTANTTSTTTSTTHAPNTTTTSTSSVSNTTSTSSGNTSNATTTTTAPASSTTTSATTTTTATATMSTGTVPPKPPTSAVEAWRLLLVFRSDKLGHSNAASPLITAGSRIEEEMEAALQKALQADPQTLHLGLGNWELLCPGLVKASYPWSSCSNDRVWLVVGCLALAAVLGAAAAALCWWQRWLCFRRAVVG